MGLFHFLPVLRPLVIGIMTVILSACMPLWQHGEQEPVVVTDGVTDDVVATDGGSTHPDDEAGVDVASLTPEDVVASMTVERKAATCIIVAGDGGIVLPDGVTLTGDAYARFVDAGWGGVILTTPNLQTPVQVTNLTAIMQEAATKSLGTDGFPLLVAVDEEGGLVSRVSGNDGFGLGQERAASELGATGSDDEAYSTGMRIGTYLAKLGFNVDFAPVVDVRTDACDDVMASRCLSDDPEDVARLASSEVMGFSDAGVATSAKHFPGLGATHGDSHDESVTCDKTIEEMESSEFVPYRRLIKEGVPMVMVGHVLTPNATGDGMPASLSHEMIVDVLRGRLGYDGVVVTDALNMQAALNAYPADELAWRVIAAGADMALMPSDPDASVKGIVSAVERGDLSEERLTEAATRVMRLRMSLVE